MTRLWTIGIWLLGVLAFTLPGYTLTASAWREREQLHQQINLLDHPVPAQRSAAVQWLSDSSHLAVLSPRETPSAVTAIIPLLDDHDPGIRARAARLLAMLHASQCVPALLARLQQDAAADRVAIIEALGVIGDPSTVPALLTILLTENDCGPATATALAQIGGDAAVDALIALLHKYLEVRFLRPCPISDATVGAALQAITKLHTARACPVLIDLLGDETWCAITVTDPYAYPHATCHALAAAALTDLGVKTVPALLAALDDPVKPVRIGAIQLLGSMRESAAVKRLLQLAQTADMDELPAIMKALAQIGGTPARTALNTWVHDPYPAIRGAVFEQLLSCHPDKEIMQALLKAAAGDSVEANRAGALLVLREWHSPDIVKACLPMLTDPSPLIRSCAADAIGASGDHQVVAPLMAQLARETDKVARRGIYTGLARLRNAQAVPALIALVRDEKTEETLRITAIDGLTGQEGLRQLLAALPELKTPSLRRACANRLATCTDPALIPNLLAVLPANPDVRDAICTALASMGDAVQPSLPTLLKQDAETAGLLLTRLPKSLALIQYLVPLLHANDDAIAQAVAAMLTRKPDRRCAPLLLAELDIPDHPRRALVLSLLAYYPTTAVIQRLSRLVKETGDCQMAESLARMGATGASQLFTLARKSHDTAVLRAVLPALVEIDDRRVVPILTDALRHADPSIATLAAQALGSLGDDGAAPLFLLAADRDPSRRLLAIDHLHTLDDQRLLTVLLASVDDGDDQVRTHAAQRLIRYPYSRRKIEFCRQGLTSSSLRVQAACTEALKALEL